MIILVTMIGLTVFQVGLEAQTYLGPSAGNKAAAAAALDKEALEIYGFDPAGMRGNPKLPESLRLNSVANYVRYDVATLVRNHKASGRTTAIDTVFREMARRKLFRVPVARGAAGKDQFFMSIANPGCAEAKRNVDGSLDLDYKYARQPGQFTIEDTICIPMEISLLAASSADLIRSRLPEVWMRMNAADAPVQ